MHHIVMTFLLSFLLSYLPTVLARSIPQVLMDTVLHPPSGGPALTVYVAGTNTIFIFVAVCVAYGMVRGCQDKLAV